MTYIKVSYNQPTSYPNFPRLIIYHTATLGIITN